MRDDAEPPIPLPCPRERADELAGVRSWLSRNAVRVDAADTPPAQAVAGGAQIARVLQRVRDAELPPLGRRPFHLPDGKLLRIFENDSYGLLEGPPRRVRCWRRNQEPPARPQFDLPQNGVRSQTIFSLFVPQPKRRS